MFTLFDLYEVCSDEDKAQKFALKYGLFSGNVQNTPKYTIGIPGERASPSNPAKIQYWNPGGACIAL